MRPSTPALAWAPALIALIAAAPAVATEAEPVSQEDRIRQLEEKVEVLTEELSKTQEEIGVPEEKPLESSWGLGPAASKVYGVSRGLSIGGYAEAFYSDTVHDKAAAGADTFDFVRAVLYTGYKFTDWLVFNAEFEFEHASTEGTGAGNAPGGGSVSVEFATLDFLVYDELNVRGGLMLVPMGFLNEMHEPPFYYGNQRPVTESVIIPSTFRENGVGLFGRVADKLEYKLYAMTSLNGAGFSDAGLRGGRQRGSEALADDWSFVGRLDYEVCPELLLGGSVMVGEADQDQRIGLAAGPGSVKLPNSLLTVWETHAQYQNRGFHARTLFSMAHVDDARRLSNALIATGDNAAGVGVAERMYGVYGEVAYEVMQWIAPETGWTVEPFFRAEYVDTQNRMPRGFDANEARRMQIYTTGVSVKPIPNVVLKLDYRNRQAQQGDLGDEINVGFGLVF